MHSPYGLKQLLGATILNVRMCNTTLTAKCWQIQIYSSAERISVTTFHTYPRDSPQACPKDSSQQKQIARLRDPKFSKSENVSPRENASFDFQKPLHNQEATKLILPVFMEQTREQRQNEKKHPKPRRRIRKLSTSNMLD